MGLPADAAGSRLQLKRFRAWPRRKQVLFWVAFFAVCGLLGYTYMLLIGVPGWVPQSVEMTAAAPARPLEPTRRAADGDRPTQ